MIHSQLFMLTFKTLSHSVLYLFSPHSEAPEADFVYCLGALACDVSGCSALFVSGYTCLWMCDKYHRGFEGPLFFSLSHYEFLLL